MSYDDFIKGTSTREKGKEAEDLACTFLEEKGYIVKKRNFHYGKLGELDIVAEINDILVFVEVKARSNDSYGSPLDSLTPRKQFQIKKVAEGYYYINKLKDKESRFDIITIDYSKNPPEIEHLESAFY
jgi:putative endonuclease